MNEFLAQVRAAWTSTGWIEFLAAILAVLYLVLAVRQRLACWAAAFVSSCLYVWVLLGAHLYMESSLNLFYAVMAVYGYRQWTGRAAAPDAARGGLGVRRGTAADNAAALMAVAVLSSVSSFFLRRFTPAAWPFADSLVTWASIYATYLVARKVYDNWYWWLAIDSASLCLYYTRRLYVTTLLFAVYLALILVGMREWRRSLEPSARAA